MRPEPSPQEGDAGDLEALPFDPIRISRAQLRGLARRRKDATRGRGKKVRRPSRGARLYAVVVAAWAAAALWC